MKKKLTLVKRHFMRYNAHWIWRWYPFTDTYCVKKWVALRLINDHEDEPFSTYKRMYIVE